MRKKRQKVKFREKWRKLWSVEKKIHFVMLTVIISLTLIAIIVSTVFLTNALTEQNRQYASEQLGIMASDCEGNLEQYKALMIATVLDDSIQEYCRSESLQTADKVSDNVYRVLQNILNIPVVINMRKLFYHSRNMTVRPFRIREAILWTARARYLQPVSPFIMSF